MKSPENIVSLQETLLWLPFSRGSTHNKYLLMPTVRGHMVETSVAHGHAEKMFILPVAMEFGLKQHLEIVLTMKIPATKAAQAADLQDCGRASVINVYTKTFQS